MLNLRLIRAGLVIIAALLSCTAQARPAPDWQLDRLDEGSIGLAELQGDVVVLDFWASWCVPCRLSLPALQGLADEFGDRKVRVVTISVDEDPAAARDFMQKYGGELIAAHDPDGRVAAAYDLLGMPSSFIIDPRGELVLTHAGFRKGDEDVWRKAILDLLPAAE